MAKVIQYQCDFPGCMQIMTESDHWFTIELASMNQVKRDLGIIPWITILPFTPEPMGNNDYFLLCGEAHVQQFISLHLKDLFPFKEEQPKEQNQFAPNMYYNEGDEPEKAVENSPEAPKKPLFYVL